MAVGPILLPIKRIWTQQVGVNTYFRYDDKDFFHKYAQGYKFKTPFPEGLVKWDW